MSPSILNGRTARNRAVFQIPGYCDLGRRSVLDAERPTQVNHRNLPGIDISDNLLVDRSDYDRKEARIARAGATVPMKVSARARLPLMPKYPDRVVAPAAKYAFALTYCSCKR